MTKIALAYQKPYAGGAVFIERCHGRRANQELHYVLVTTSTVRFSRKHLHGNTPGAVY